MVKTTKDLQNSFNSTAKLEIENLKLKEKNKALDKTVTKLCEELNRVRNIDTNVTKIFLSAEEEICVFQIEQIRAVSRERKLSLEEVKTLDLLIKNKRLMDKKSTSNAEITLPPNLSDEELMRIAESVEEKDQGDK